MLRPKWLPKRDPNETQTGSKSNTTNGTRYTPLHGNKKNYRGSRYSDFLYFSKIFPCFSIILLILPRLFEYSISYHRVFLLPRPRVHENNVRVSTYSKPVKTCLYRPPKPCLWHDIAYHIEHADPCAKQLRNVNLTHINKSSTNNLTDSYLFLSDSCCKLRYNQ